MDGSAMVEEAPLQAGPRIAASVVSVRGLVKGYGGQQAVCGVDLDVRSGEIYGLIGPDGAGKSSIMKAVAGVTTFDAGSIEVFGIEIHSEKTAERIKDRTGFMPQGLGQNLYPELSVDENLEFFARSRLVPREDLPRRKELLLEMTRLSPFRHRAMKNLSGGMKQKLGLVCTLIHEPSLVILDEPTTGVDPVSRRDFWAILSRLLREHSLTAIVSTAYMDEASRFHRLSLVFGGQMVATGTPEEIGASVPGSLVEVRARRQEDALAALQKRFPDVEPRGSRIRVFVKGASEEEAARRVGEALGAGGARTGPGMEADIGAGSEANGSADAGSGATGFELRAGAPGLEDIFIAILREKKVFSEDRPIEGAAPIGAAPLYRRHAEANGAAIEAENLVRDFDDFRAVDGVSFRVARGEIFGLLGANGAGKTTVIKMLVGLLRPTGGTGFVAGYEMRRASRVIRESIGYMSQVFSLYGDLTVVENIRLYAGIYGLDHREAGLRAKWIVEMAGLSGHEGHRTGGLPAGVRQRLALGCALVHRPSILFLDEPTSGVDPVGRRRFWDILFRLSRNDGVAILVTTHYMSEAERCDHLALMYAGKIVADASPGEMKRQLQAEAGRLLEVSTDRPLDALELLQLDGFEGVALHGRQIHLLAPDLRVAEQRIEAALAPRGVELLGIAEQALSMEDVFVYRVLALERAGRPGR